MVPGLCATAWSAGVPGPLVHAGAGPTERQRQEHRPVSGRPDLDRHARAAWPTMTVSRGTPSALRILCPWSDYLYVRCLADGQVVALAPHARATLAVFDGQAWTLHDGPENLAWVTAVRGARGRGNTRRRPTADPRGGRRETAPFCGTGRGSTWGSRAGSPGAGAGRRGCRAGSSGLPPTEGWRVSTGEASTRAWAR